MSRFPKSGSCTFSKLLLSVWTSNFLNTFSPLALDHFLCWCLSVPNARYHPDYGIFSAFKFFFKALYFWVALSGKTASCCCLFHLSQSISLLRFKRICFTSLYLMPLLSPSCFSPSCFIVLIICVHLIYCVTCAKAIWPNSHPNYAHLLHKDGVRAVILVLLIHQDLNLGLISFLQ